MKEKDAFLPRPNAMEKKQAFCIIWSTRAWPDIPQSQQCPRISCMGKCQCTHLKHIFCLQMKYQR